MIDFPNQFLPKKEIECLTVEERKNVHLQDPNIINRIMTKKEMEGILLWAVNGLNRLFEKKDFSNKETAMEIKRNWLRGSNSVAAFIMDEISESYEKAICKKDFKRNYLAYCRSNKLKPLSDKVIKITIENETGASSDRHYINGEKTYIWEGIKFRDNSEYGANKNNEV
jgi:phage/plasmid-associated DNA primase